MNLNKLYAMLLFFLALLQFSFGQERIITGKVKDVQGIEIPGVAIVIKGEKSGTETDFSGKYSIKVATGKTLVFSAMGLKTREVKVANQQSIDVVLEEAAQDLDEVVVVAYGTAKKQSLVGSQTNISAKQLETRPISNISNALQGASPGVQAITSGGQPGQSAAIRIRGFGSINAGNAPVYVVDGSIYNGNISSISVQDIESVSVLKDAASTSLYGSSAGNGVILITTKSGGKGKKGKPIINYSNNIGFSTQGQESYETVSAQEYYPLRWQQWFNDNKYNRNFTDINAAGQAMYDVLKAFQYQPYAGVKSYYQNVAGNWSITQTPIGTLGTDYVPALVMPNGSLNPEINGLLWGDDLDWEKGILRTGIRNEHSVSISDTSEKVKSYLSINYVEDEGYLKTTLFERFGGRANLSYDVTKWLTVGTNASYTKENRQYSFSTGGGGGNPLYFARNIAPIYPIHRHNADGSYILDNEGNRIYDYGTSNNYAFNRSFLDKYNPVYQSSGLDLYLEDANSLTTRNFFTIKLLPELKLTANYTYDILADTRKQRYNNILGDQPDGFLTISNRKYITTTFNQLLQYEKDFGKHHINALLGHESYEYSYIYNGADKKKAFLDDLNEFVNYEEISSVGSQTDKYTKEGYFGRLNYGFDKRYDVSFSYRRDGSSRFHKDNRWGNFWSVGAAWNVINEQFLQNISWLNNLKLRASYGKTGNDATQDVNQNSTYYPYQTTFSVVRNNTSTGLRVSNYGNQDLVWEKQVSTDIALEFSLFDRIRASVEWFNKESEDLIFAYDLPISTGLGSIDRNIGKIQNRGWEFDVAVDILKNTDFKWSVNANATMLKNKVLTLPDNVRKKGIVTGNFKRFEGYSIYDYYLPIWAGVNPQNGRAMYVIDGETYPTYVDVNHTDFKGVNKDEYAAYTYDYNIAKKDFSGSALPDVYGGFSTNASYKRFDLSVQFAYQLGGYIYDTGYASFMGRDLSSGDTAHRDLLNAWKQPGDTSNIPALDVSVNGQYASNTSSRFLISRSALALKNISLSYTLPAEIVQKINVQNIRFGVAAENLFLWSKRKGLNPMGSFTSGLSNYSYGYAKTITCNLSVSF